MDDMQDELKDLLFGEEDSKKETEKRDYIGKPVVKSSDNSTKTNANNPRKVGKQQNQFL